MLFLGRNPQAPFEIIRLYLEAGGKANKCVMSHLDRKWHVVVLYLIIKKCFVFLNLFVLIKILITFIRKPKTMNYYR